MAHSSRTWRGARTPQALKRVRQAARRRAVLQPRRSEIKTLVAKAITMVTEADAEGTRQALSDAVSALDKAAKAGAIHRNAADRRKSRLMRKIGAALGGEALVGTAKSTRVTGRAAAQKAAKARIAAGKATKAKGEQTAAGKARAALSRSSRETGTQAAPAAEAPAKSSARAAKGTSSPSRRAASGGSSGASASGAKVKARAAGTKAAGGDSGAAPSGRSTARRSASKDQPGT